MTQVFSYSQYSSDYIKQYIQKWEGQLPPYMLELLTGEAVVEQNRDDDLEDYLSEQTYVPSLALTRSTTQAITSGTGGFIQFDGIAFQSTNVFDWVVADPTKLTISDSGIVSIVGNVSWDTAAGGDFRTAQLFVNGLDIGGGSTVTPLGGAGAPQAPAAALYNFVAGDYIQLFANQDSGGPLNITSARLGTSYQGKSG